MSVRIGTHCRVKIKKVAQKSDHVHFKQNETIPYCYVNPGDSTG